MDAASQRDEGPQAYADRLAGYTLSELEDVYAHLDRKTHSERFELVRGELERRLSQMGRTPPEVGPPQAETPGDVAAGFFRRWWGSLLDLFVQVFILAVVYLVYALMSSILVGFGPEETATEAAEGGGSPFLAFFEAVVSGDTTVLADSHMLGQVTLVVLGFLAYRSLLTVPAWKRSGQTPGMREVGVRLVADGGTKIGYGQAWIRFLAQHILFPLTLGFSGMWILFDRRHKALHDRIARTQVLRAARTWEKATELRMYDD